MPPCVGVSYDARSRAPPTHTGLLGRPSHWRAPAHCVGIWRLKRCQSERGVRRAFDRTQRELVSQSFFYVCTSRASNNTHKARRTPSQSSPFIPSPQSIRQCRPPYHRASQNDDATQRARATLGLQEERLEQQMHPPSPRRRPRLDPPIRRPDRPMDLQQGLLGPLPTQYTRPRPRTAPGHPAFASALQSRPHPSPAAATHSPRGALHALCVHQAPCISIHSASRATHCGCKAPPMRGTHTPRQGARGAGGQRLKHMRVLWRLSCLLPQPPRPRACA